MELRFAFSMTTKIHLLKLAFFFAILYFRFCLMVSKYFYIKREKSIVTFIFSIMGLEKAKIRDGFRVIQVSCENVFFNNQHRQMKMKRFICIKQIKSSFFSNS